MAAPTKTFWLAICLDCRPHLDHMDKRDGSLRIKGGEWTGSGKPETHRGEKGALGSPITDDSGLYGLSKNRCDAISFRGCN